MSKQSTLKKLNYTSKCLHEATATLKSISEEDCTERTRKCIDSVLYEIECAIKWMGHIDMSDYGVARVGENIVAGLRQGFNTRTQSNNEDRTR